MEEQARLSQLAFDSDSKPPQWSTDGCPRLLGGWRKAHASIVVGEGNQESIIVLGGFTGKEITNSVLVMNTTGKQFREGPSMSEKRHYFAVRKVNIGVYACGGFDESNKSLDTIERIDVNELLETPATSKTGKWKTLPCRLTTPRGGCTGCDVMNRYLVIVGGYNGRTYVSSVDILDTGGDGNNHTIIAGIDMNCARCTATSEVIGTRMFVVGGQERNNKWIRSVEYVEFGCHDKSDSVISVFQANSCWTLDNDIALSQVNFWNPAMTKIGKCLVVAGGHDLPSVEVLDTDRRVVWSLPSMTRARQGGIMVALSKSIVVVSGGTNDSLESLSIHLSQREQLKAQSCKVPRDEKAMAHNGSTRANLPALPQTDSFYAKLVESNDDPIIVKVHELSGLVFHVHHIKVFYTFLNHLCRAGRISLEHRRRYTTRALTVINKTIRNATKEEQNMCGTILEKAVEDGALNEGDSEEIKQHNKTVGSTGNCFFLVQRISALEENCGMDSTTGMTLADRVSQLEDLVLCDSTSDIHAPAAAVQNKQPRSVLARVEQLESTMVNCFSLVQRISALEENSGLDSTGMTLADRVSQSEDLVFKDT